VARSIVRFSAGEAIRWGVLQGPPPQSPADSAVVRPLVTAVAGTAELLNVLDSGCDEESARSVPASAFRSPITSDAQLVCQGLNYRSHAEEAAHAHRRRNLIFAKAASSLAGAFEPIVRPAAVELLDYEVEIGIVIRRRLDRATSVNENNLGEFVAGVVLCNDISARDTMFAAPFMQWYQGKSFRGFCPCGPTLLLLDRDEVSSTLLNLRIELSVNGERRQTGDSSQLIFPPAPTLSELSDWLDLNPGDLLLTGTPAGVTASASPGFVDALRTHLFDDETRVTALRRELTQGRPFLKPGDRVTATLSDVRNGQLLAAHDTSIAGAA
jgi:2-keto-4-pentenoate hydratase/2-oxohepta-3-ene-1,7-dioic acid hydratase in catechol pathway